MFYVQIRFVHYWATVLKLEGYESLKAAQLAATQANFPAHSPYTRVIDDVGMSWAVPYQGEV